MLARLEAIEGVELAEVDHRGELLRLRSTSDHALEDALATLRELGYGAEEISGAPAVERWYGRDTVRELSREEGDVIARRIVPGFARSRELARSSADQLEAAVAQALYACFAAHTLDANASPGALVHECVRAVEEAARELIGADRASELASLLSDDLDRVRSRERRPD